LNNRRLEKLPQQGASQLAPFAKYNYNDPVMEGQIGRDGREKVCIEGFAGKARRK
jgi:hypothetical protein